MQAGEAVDPRRWASDVRLGGRQVADVVDPVAVATLLHEGATVVLQSLHRTVPAVGRFAADLEAQVSHPVQVNAYLTPPGSAGLAVHAETAEGEVRVRLEVASAGAARPRRPADRSRWGHLPLTVEDGPSGPVLVLQPAPAGPQPPERRAR